ncbi:MAG: hypothetical protein ABWZ25_16715, partial [Chitinophagaceae bacterium]
MAKSTSGYSQSEDGIKDDPRISRLTGTTGDTALTKDKFAVTSFTSGYENSSEIKNIVTLKVIEETPRYIATDFTATIRVKIEYGESAASLNSLPDQDLTVDYKKGEGVKYNARNYISFGNARYVKVIVIESTFSPASVGNVDVRDLLALENEMRVTRNYELSANAGYLIPTTLTHAEPSAGADELPVSWSWPLESGRTHTQLEWTWVEDELITNYYTAGNLDYMLLFRNNAARVDLSYGKNGYNIPLLYGGQGKIYFRIRAVNIKKSGIRTDGPWSTVQSRSFVGHNNIGSTKDSLNWQSSISFAEEGKRKAVVTYFDGSLRSRQTVTKDNTTNTVVTAETFYDAQGRPAVQILPVPGTGNVIGYSRGLNLFKANAQLNLPDNQTENEDPLKFFDLEPIAVPTSLTAGLQTSTGASKYYSTDNPDKTGGNAQIPDAEGYPYTVTRYKQDGTERIISQSGVGAAMKMGSSHETSYYYGTPYQEELDGLFGTEVGVNTHYFTNMVKDANGQMSISYVDMHGRTVATSLAGSAPANMVALNTNDATQYPEQKGSFITTDLLNNNSNAIKGNSVESINTLLVPATTRYTFNYKLDPDVLSLPSCSSGTLCYDGMYDLEISIIDESGDVPPLVKKFSNVNLNADNICSSAPQGFKDADGNLMPDNIITIDAVLQPGSYIVRKTLVISEASLQKYRDDYLTKGLCKTESELIDSVKTLMLSTSDCNVVPANACDACRTTLGDYNSFKANYLASGVSVPESGIQASYSAAKQNCDRLCNDASQILATKRSMMVSDLILYNGQYATGVVPTDPVALGLYNKYSVFSEASAGTPAEELLPRHPEYQRLLFAEGNLQTSYNWINTFSNTTSYETAMGKNYIFTSAANLNDPYYIAATGDKNAIVAKVTNDYRNGLSLWQIAYGDVRCKTIVSPYERNKCYSTTAPKVPPADNYNGAPHNFSVAEKNQLWVTFRNLYTNVRDSQVNVYIAAQSPLADAQLLVDKGFRLHFPTQAQMVQQNNQNGDWSFWPSAPGADPVPGNIPGGYTPGSVYTSRCNSYIGQWKQALSQCPALAIRSDKEAILNEVTSAMELVCQKGSNEANPYGSSNVAPNSPDDGSPRSFEEVIDYILRIKYGIATDALCNPYVIEFPKPYGKGPIFTKEMIVVLDTCNCGRFYQLKSEASVAGYNPSMLGSMNQYLKAKYTDTLTQVLYDAMVNNCSKLATTSCADSTVNFGGNCSGTIRICATTATTYPLIVPQPLPGFLKCGFVAGAQCIDCATISALTREFKDSIPSPYNAGPVFTGADLTPENIRDNIMYARFLNYRTGFQYNWTDYAAAAAKANCNLASYNNNAGAMQNVICANSKPLNDTTGMVANESPCKRVETMAIALAQQIYQQRKENLLADFEKAYRDKCLAAVDREKFTLDYTVKQYHYTLYYYDMAGNLVKTVPPAGVRPRFAKTFTDSVKAYREAGNFLGRPHLLVTNYRYNTIGSVVAQNSPDAGASAFWYDRIGRLVVSQNAQQALDGKYSYTLYDDLGRIIEVGQKPQSMLMTQTISQDAVALKNWIMSTGGTREQLTLTEYDVPFGFSLYPEGIMFGKLTQRNLRNRVSYSATKNLATDNNHFTASFYTYDIHGNVDTLLQDYNGIAEMSADYLKKIEYDFDLISGKVNSVSYQTDKPDAFYHRYQYDAENRLTEVYTSRDKIVWERDAAYSYSKHGVLARTVLGHQQVQGLDYAYTL